LGVAEFRYEKLEGRDGRWEMGDGRWEMGEKDKSYLNSAMP
jgi:hypothetical protein